MSLYPSTGVLPSTSLFPEVGDTFADACDYRASVTVAAYTARVTVHAYTAGVIVNDYTTAVCDD